MARLEDDLVASLGSRSSSRSRSPKVVTTPPRSSLCAPSRVAAFGRPSREGGNAGGIGIHISLPTSFVSLKTGRPEEAGWVLTLHRGSDGTRMRRLGGMRSLLVRCNLRTCGNVRWRQSEMAAAEGADKGSRRITRGVGEETGRVRNQETTAAGGGKSSLSSFYERPILNSPYRAPELHHPLDANGQPLEGEPRRGRRPSRFIVPVPASRKKPSSAQASLDLETYTENALINEIRGYVDTWRRLPNPAD